MTTQQVTPEQLTDAGFWHGLRVAARGAGMILQRPKLLGYVLLAFLVNGLLIGGLLWWGWHAVDGLQGWLLQQQAAQASGAWGVVSGALGKMFLGLKWLVLVLILYFVVPTLYNLLLNLNPLSAHLAGLMFTYVFQEKAKVSLPEVPFAEGLLRSISAEIRKLFLMLTWMILALLCNLIPLLGPLIAVALMFLIGIQFSGWSYLTPYYDALCFGYQKQRTAMRRQRWMIWGVGLISAIPLVNLMALFVGPVAGALLSAEAHQKVLADTPAGA